MNGDKTSKADALSYLLSEGYDACIADGVVCIYLSDEDYIKVGAKVKRQVQKQLEGIGYTDSMSVAPRRN